MMNSNTRLFLHDHSVSSYAQKVRIALREKGLAFDAQTPEGLGSGRPNTKLYTANPRMEVPALEDGEFKIFDSSVILGYLEDKYPDPALLPKSPAARASAKMIEEVCDTHYEAINWGYGEVTWFDRATGELAEKLKIQARRQTEEMFSWLAGQLGSKQWFNGDHFGYTDLVVAPYLNRSVSYGFTPAQGSPLQVWHAKVKERPSVKTTFDEFDRAVGKMAGAKDLFMKGGARREYRDHRLEWMIKSGGIEVVLDGLKNGNIRFSWPHPSL